MRRATAWISRQCSPASEANGADARRAKCGKPAVWAVDSYLAGRAGVCPRSSSGRTPVMMRGAAPHDCLVFRQSVRGTRELGQAPFGLARSAWVPLTDGRPRRKSVLKPQVSLGQTHLPSVPDARGVGLLPRGLTPAPGRAGPGPTRVRARDVGPARSEPLTRPAPRGALGSPP